MSRDIDFVHNNLSFGELFGIKGCHGYKGYNCASHRTRLKGGGSYEDYGVRLWLNTDGSLKKSKEHGEKRIILEGQCYEPRDYYKKWEVTPIHVGNYCAGFTCYLDSASLCLYEIVAIEGGFSTLYEEKPCCLPRKKLIGQIEKRGNKDWDYDEWTCYTYENGDEHYNLKEHNMITPKMIREVFDEKFWKALDEVIRIPDFPVQISWSDYIKYY